MKIGAFKNQTISYCKSANSKKINSKYNVKNSISLPKITNAQQNIELQLLKQETEFEEFLSKSYRITKEEYEDIKNNHPHILLKARDYIKNYKGRTTPLQLAKMVLLVYKYLNENYENFRIISIGTSPSALSEQMEKMGCDVVYVPVSGLGKFDLKNDNVEDNPELVAILNYIHSKKLDDGKLNLVLDFSVTGTTLKIITELIKEYCSLENTISVSLEPLIDKAISDMYFKVHDARQNILDDIWECKIEQISNTPHFPIEKYMKTYYLDSSIQNTIFLNNVSDEELFEKFENSATPLARAFSLCTMAEIDKLKGSGKYDN